MKNKIYKIIAIICFSLLFPTALTLFINGKRPSPTQKMDNSGRTIIIKTDNNTIKMDMEEFIPCVLSNQLAIETHPQALMAQAVIIRTYILYYMEENSSIDASSLNLPFTTYEELKNIVGDDFTEYYTKLKDAVSQTSSQVLTYNGKLIVPYFHGISAGKTRNGNEALSNEDYPYLVSKESPYDTSSQDYLDITYIDKSEFVKNLKEHRPEIVISEENPLMESQVLSRCSAGYISSIQIGDQTFTGDEIQVYFSLKSPYFELENFENQIRIICKGNGHGLGLSIFGSSKMAEEGKTYKEILTYYFTGVNVE